MMDRGQATYADDLRQAIKEFEGVHAKLFDRASAYAKSVVAVGYAAILAVWGFAKVWMLPAAHPLGVQPPGVLH